jgi:hypothetical protein
MGHRANPRCAMNIEAHIVAIVDGRLAGMQSHPNVHVASVRPASAGKRPLRGHSSGNRVACAGEGDKERVALLWTSRPPCSSNAARISR